MLAASALHDNEPFSQVGLEAMLSKLDGLIEGGLESARRFRQFQSLTGRDLALFRTGTDAARTFLLANPLAVGFRGRHHNVYVTKEEMDAMLAASAIHDETPFSQEGLEAMQSKLDGLIEAASMNNSRHASLKETKTIKTQKDRYL